MFTFCKNSQKGQDLVEYALMLAIILGIGWGIYSQTGVADSIKNVFGNASSLMEAVKKDKEPFDMEAVLKRLVTYRRGTSAMGMVSITSAVSFPLCGSKQKMRQMIK